MRYLRGILTFPSFNNPDLLFSAIVRIAATSIAVILALSSIAFYQIYSREVIRDANETAVKVSRAMLGQQRDILLLLDSSGKYQLRLDQANLPGIDHYFRTYLANFNVIKLKVYNLSQEIIYSSDAKIIGKRDKENPRLNRALKGEIDSHIEKKDQMLDLAEESKFKVSVVETYIPIIAGDKIVGAFEIYTDVTNFTKETMSIVTITLIWLTVIILSVFACSYIVIKKATNLLKDAQQNLADKVEELENALATVHQLEGIIPICSWCKKIRDDEKSWHQIESYISSHSEAKFSHGVCPECYEIQMKELENM